MLREFVAEILWRSIESSQGTIEWWSGSKAHLRAKIVVATQTTLAASTRCSWLEDNTVSDLERLHLGTNLDNCSCRFVPEHHRIFDDEGADPSLFPVVHIAAADAGVVYGYENIVGRLEGGNWSFGERYIVSFVENEGEVL